MRVHTCAESIYHPVDLHLSHKMFYRAPFHGDAPAEEFLAMTLVNGPEEAVFQDDYPAKLRFFMGYADEFSREDGTEQVSCDCILINIPRSSRVKRSAFFSHAYDLKCLRFKVFAEPCLCRKRVPLN